MHFKEKTDKASACTVNQSCINHDINKTKFVRCCCQYCLTLYWFCSNLLYIFTWQQDKMYNSDLNTHISMRGADLISCCFYGCKGNQVNFTWNNSLHDCDKGVCVNSHACHSHLSSYKSTLVVVGNIVNAIHITSFPDFSVRDKICSDSKANDIEFR